MRRLPVTLLILAASALGCDPTESLDAALPLDAGQDSPSLDARMDDDARATSDAHTDDDASATADASTTDDAPLTDDAPTDDAFVAADAHASPDAPGDGGFLTSLSCPDFLGLPIEGATLPGVLPEGVRIGPDCSVYVALANHVYRVAQGSGAVTDFATRPTGDFQGVEFGPGDRMYVTDRTTDSVLRFVASSGVFVDVFASTTLDGPNTPRFGPDGRLYVSNRNTGNVVRFAPDGAALGEFATHPLLASPEGISFGPDGNLYVAARIHSVVMRFDGTTGALLTQITPSGAGFMAPENLAFTSDGSLWIASRDAREILRFDAYTGVEIERFATLATEEPIGMDVAADHLVVGMRGTGRVVVFR